MVDSHFPKKIGSNSSDTEKTGFTKDGRTYGPTDNGQGGGRIPACR